VVLNISKAIHAYPSSDGGSEVGWQVKSDVLGAAELKRGSRGRVRVKMGLEVRHEDELELSKASYTL
jgi:hypothetical protein